MTRALAALLLGLTVLASCGAGEPPRAQGGIDLTEFWREAP